MIEGGWVIEFDAVKGAEKRVNCDRLMVILRRNMKEKRGGLIEVVMTDGCW